MATGHAQSNCTFFIPRSKEEDFNGNAEIITKSPKFINPKGVHKIYNYLSLRCYIRNLVKICPAWEDDVNGRRTVMDANPR